MDGGPHSLIGLKPQPHTARDIQSDRTFLDKSLSKGFSCFCLPITNQAYRQVCKEYFQSWSKNIDAKNSLGDLIVPFPDSNHTDISNGPHIEHSVGLISSWIELDNDDIVIDEFSFQVFHNEISYASYLGIKTFILSPPINVHNIQIFSLNISKILHLFPAIQISISLPISQDLDYSVSTYHDVYSTWETWNSIRIACNYHPNLSVSLGAPLYNIPSAILDRWMLEPIQFYLIPLSRFIPNAKSYPVLPKFNQLIIWKLLQFKTLEPPVIILHGIDRLNAQNSPLPKNMIEFHGPEKNSTYLSYIKHLSSISYKTNFLPKLYSFTLSTLKDSNISKTMLSSKLVLQSPLEPIIENLDNYTYRVFEQDSFKYEQYERAIIKALIDLNKSWSSDSKPHIFFLGAGRGPLIDRFFSALQFLSLSPDSFTITAIERSPNVMIYLSQRNLQCWNSSVNILNIDSRDYINSPYNLTHSRLNMVISELIGSFGCNELMPECIDGISRSDICDPDCIFIPENLQVHIAPVYSPRLWKTASDISTDKLYVPLIPEMELLTENTNEIWEFHSSVTQKTNLNPNLKAISSLTSRSNNRHNARQRRVTMKIFHRGLVHGLSGFFSSTLYSDISISNLPKSPEVPDCVSWLPAYLPFQTPLEVFEDQDINLFIKRVCSNNCVWYEWSAECFSFTQLVNQNKPEMSMTKTPPATPASNNETLQISKIPTHGLSMTTRQDSDYNSEKASDCFPVASYDDASSHYVKNSPIDKSINSNFNLVNDDNKSEQEDDCHFKIRTGLTRVHNINGFGQKFSLN